MRRPPLQTDVLTSVCDLDLDAAQRPVRRGEWLIELSPGMFSLPESLPIGLQPNNWITHRMKQVRTSGDCTQRIDSQSTTADALARLATCVHAKLDPLERTFEQKKLFMADASHPFRTPLTTLKGLLQITLCQPLNQDTHLETLQAQGGTGLGLAIVREIVHRHHGVIGVRSAPSQGTTFTVCFPRQRSRPCLLSPTGAAP
jgi:signal transduction histidine kinase